MILGYDQNLNPHSKFEKTEKLLKRTVPHAPDNSPSQLPKELFEEDNAYLYV